MCLSIASENADHVMVLSCDCFCKSRSGRICQDPLALAMSRLSDTHNLRRRYRKFASSVLDISSPTSFSTIQIDKYRKNGSRSH